MKYVIWILVLVLLISFVNAEIKISCETDSACYLINKESSCVEGYWYSPIRGYMTIEDLQPRNNEFEWNIVNIEPKTTRCENCLILAPEIDNWFTKFVNWIFFLD